MKYSAGLLLYKQTDQQLEVLLVHPGGPFWAKKDLAAWSLPKGEYLPEEDPLSAAKREFSEELGQPAPEGTPQELGTVKYNGKEVVAWAIAADFDTKNFKSNTFEMEWPSRSGNKQSFLEVDKATWLDYATAEQKVVKGQIGFLQKLAELLQLDPEQLRAQTAISPATDGSTSQTSLF
jgi:predicted NUDIX family NTP pyrophosphohydrolase